MKVIGLIHGIRIGFMYLLMMSSGLVFHHALQASSFDQSSPPLPDKLDKPQLVIKLLDWINRNSHYSYQGDEIPEIVSASAEVLIEIAYGEELPRALNTESLKIYGLYDFKKKVIYILDSLDIRSAQGQAILLHELVHFLQYQHNEDLTVECKNKLEALAYSLEKDYLGSKKQDGSFHLPDIQSISQCH